MRLCFCVAQSAISDVRSAIGLGHKRGLLRHVRDDVVSGDARYSSIREALDTLLCLLVDAKDCVDSGEVDIEHPS